MILSRSAACATGVILAACAAGCATGPPLQQSAVELETVPFYAQSAYQCGPAALATVLSHSGVRVSPDTITNEVYIPGLKGSLQVELAATARRYGRIPFRIPADSEALLAELDAGNPVLVLQNKGFRRFPKWHYAVVVGYEPEHNRFVLRSGGKARKTERAPLFLRSWQQADNWGIVTVPPAVIPATATAQEWAEALAASEPFFDRAASELGYRTALERWPDNALLLFGAANFHYAGEQYEEAYRLYRQLLEREPRHVAARNNLGNLLLENGCANDAMSEMQIAQQGLEDEDPLSPAVQDSLARVQSALESSANADCRFQ